MRIHSRAQIRARWIQKQLQNKQCSRRCALRPARLPGSPAFVGKADSYRVDAKQHGFDINLEGHNAVQGSFRFAA